MNRQFLHPSHRLGVQVLVNRREDVPNDPDAREDAILVEAPDVVQKERDLPEAASHDV